MRRNIWNVLKSSGTSVSSTGFLRRSSNRRPFEKFKSETATGGGLYIDAIAEVFLPSCFFFSSLFH